MKSVKFLNMLLVSVGAVLIFFGLYCLSPITAPSLLVCLVLTALGAGMAILGIIRMDKIPEKCKHCMAKKSGRVSHNG